MLFMRVNIFNKFNILICVMLFTENVIGNTNYQYGEVNASLFTGHMSYTIPIYTVEDPDFPLDISLKYNTDGFKPFEPSGTYGLDWTLVAGGHVSRSVQGRADEQKTECTEYSSTGIYGVGMLQAIKDGEIPNKDSVFDFTTQLYKPECGIQYYASDYRVYAPVFKSYCEWDRDYMPDIYYFNFCGHKGSFIINNTGNAVIVSGDFIRVDFHDFKDTYSYESAPKALYVPSDASRITICTTDGYRYEFGGSNDAVEYTTATLINNTNIDQDGVPAISKWYLTKITAPNGRYMTFSYVHLSSGNTLANGLHSFITEYDWAGELNDTNIVYLLHKDCVLKSITTSDSVPLNISFSSSLESKRKYNHADFTLCQPHLQLDSIIVKYGGEKRRTAYLNYQYKSYENEYGAFTDYCWRYLRWVYISGVGTYTMTYNVFDPYHNPNSNHGGQFGLHWYPNLYTKTNRAYLNTVDRCGFWKVSSLQGMLSEVSLPTGGKLRFTYGGHQYGEERRFRAVGERDVELQTLLTSNQTMGGARIEKIETFSDDTTLVETKTFSYFKHGTTNSSGVFYNIHEVFLLNDITNGHPVANPFNYGMIDSHIGYSYVEQVTSASGQSYKTTYTFDTGNKTYSSLNNSLINRRDSVPDYDSVKEICSGSLTHDGWLKQTGKLLKTEKYIGNTLAKSIQYKYNGPTQNIFGQYTFEENALGCLDTIVCLSKYSAHIARKLLVCPDVLEQVTTTEYDTNGDALVSSTTNTYDSKLRIKQTTFLDGQGVKYFTKYTYPDDVPGSDQLTGYPTPLFILSQSTTNRIGDPVETISGYIENNTEYITEGKIKIYGMNTYAEGNALHFVPYLNKTMSLSLSSPITTYTYMSALNSQVTYDEHYRLDCEYFFDTMLRPLSVKPYGETETRYTWNGIYPVSKTVGNQTTTYTYIPYVGVSSMTDPRGITTYYTYDSAGRLIETYQIINDRKLIINAYKYHIKTE